MKNLVKLSIVVSLILTLSYTQKIIFAVDKDEQKIIFENYYTEWKEYVAKAEKERPFSEQISSVKSSKLIYDNEPFKNLVKLGVDFVPFIIEKLNEDRRLIHALYAITKWKYHVVRNGNKPNEFVWEVEEFSDIKQTDGPPDSNSLWVRWWEEGRKQTSQQFEKLHSEWKVLKKAGKEKEAAEKFKKMQDLGIDAIPSFIEKIGKDDIDLIPALEYLTDGEVNQKEIKVLSTDKAKSKHCVDWWNKNKEKWTIRE